MVEHIRKLLSDKHYKLIKKADDISLKEFSSDMKVTLRDVDSVALCVEVPQGKKAGQIHIGILNEEEKGLRKSCDYLIFTRDNNQLSVYFIELKKTLDLSREDTVQGACAQILSTMPVWEYIREKIKVHYGEDYKKPRIYNVIIGEKLNNTIDKQGVKFFKPRKIPYPYEKYNFRYNFGIFCGNNIPFKLLKKWK